MFNEPQLAVETADPRDELIRQQAEKIRLLETEIVRLKELLTNKADAKAAKKPVFKGNYSLDRNKQRSLKPKDKPAKKPGRKRTKAKLKRATRQVNIYPPGAAPKDCTRVRSQFAWRIIDGKAIYVCYHIYDRPASAQPPLPAGLRNSRCEFGIEIILILAFLHYWIGMSLDNACQTMGFFTGLELPKSQAYALLKQLAADWDEQYDTIAELIALQMIVYIDETGWKVGNKGCYTWVFSTALHVLYRCGVSRRKDEAEAVLGDSFAGIGVSDDYAAYKSLFSQHQLCWAHLIRKAIKLALQNPDIREYANFLDQLCSIYHDAKDLRDAHAGPSADAAAKTSRDLAAVVEQLQARVAALCTRATEPLVKAASSEHPATAAHLETFILLQRELLNNLECLFVFVSHPDVEPTNNRSERNARREAEIRKGARTSKTAAGANRRGIIITVLASLQTRIKKFTLSKLLEEVNRWLDAGQSIFEEELDRQKANRPLPHPT